MVGADVRGVNLRNYSGTSIEISTYIHFLHAPVGKGIKGESSIQRDRSLVSGLETIAFPHHSTSGHVNL